MSAGWPTKNAGWTSYSAIRIEGKFQTTRTLAQDIGIENVTRYLDAVDPLLGRRSSTAPADQPHSGDCCRRRHSGSMSADHRGSHEDRSALPKITRLSVDVAEPG